MWRMVAVVLLVVAVSGCGHVPVMHESKSENPQIPVYLVTEFEGVRLYAVDTGNQLIYVAVSAAELRTSWMEQQGKVTVEQAVLTVNK